MGRDGGQVGWLRIRACSQARAEPEGPAGPREAGPPSALDATRRCPGQGSRLQRCGGPEMGQRDWPARTEGAGWCPGRLGGEQGGQGSRLPPSEHRHGRTAAGLRSPLPLRGCASPAVGSAPAPGPLFFSRSVVSDSSRPVDCSTPGLPAHRRLLEFVQTHVHRVGDAMQPSHPLSPPSLPIIRVFSSVSALHIRWPKD